MSCCYCTVYRTTRGDNWRFGGWLPSVCDWANSGHPRNRGLQATRLYCSYCASETRESRQAHDQHRIIAVTKVSRVRNGISLASVLEMQHVYSSSIAGQFVSVFSRFWRPCEKFYRREPCNCVDKIQYSELGIAVWLAIE